MAYALRSLGQSFSDGHLLEAHTHPWGQVIFAETGTMRVVADYALWLVPQGRALWAPPHVAHEITMRGPVAMRGIYVPPERAGALPDVCRAYEVSPLLRELIIHIVSRGMLDAANPEHDRLAGVFLDLFAKSEELPLALPMPRDARALALATRLRDEPADDARIETLAKEAGASPRTLQRLFRAETNMRFVEWRLRLRLLQAVTQLGAGASVTEAGANAGFSSTSAFIAAFRQQMGHTPARYKAK
jgi:AraC-like DNA-binding protein